MLGLTYHPIISLFYFFFFLSFPGFQEVDLILKCYLPYLYLLVCFTLGIGVRPCSLESDLETFCGIQDSFRGSVISNVYS